LSPPLPLAQPLEALNLVLDAVRNTSLQDIGDVNVQLAVLMPERGHRDDHRGLDLLKLPQHLAQLPGGGSSCGSGGHEQRVFYFYTRRQHECDGDWRHSPAALHLCGSHARKRAGAGTQDSR
jgi:hypothetical protein